MDGRIPFGKNIPIQWVLEKIRVSDEIELSQMTKEIVGRYAQEHPDWIVTYVSMPKDPVKRREQLKRLFEFYEKHPDA